MILGENKPKTNILTQKNLKYKNTKKALEETFIII